MGYNNNKAVRAQLYIRKGDIMQIYQLMNKDNLVLEFIKADTLEGQFKIIYENKYANSPYLLKNNSGELDTWINSRAIPNNRDHIEKVLMSLNLDSKGRFNLS